jgi:dihydroneopterin aldolase
MDTIQIVGLQLKTILGVHAWEQQVSRPIVVDLDLDVDARIAAASDHLRDAVDYKAVCDDIAALVNEQPFRLIETLAEAIARRIMSRFPVLGLRVRVAKPGAIPAAGGVAVRIERRREDYAVCGR